MSTSASLDIKLSSRGFESLTSVKVLQLLIHYGWNIRENDKVLYLPLGDEDDFDWQDSPLDDSALFDIIVKKEQANEIVGIGLTWKDTSVGGTLLMYSNLDMSFSLTINRQRFLNDITDVNWYLERILPCFETASVAVESFTFCQN